MQPLWRAATTTDLRQQWMPRHDATPPLPTGVIRIGLFDVTLQVPQIVDRTPITAITIDGRATPPKVMTTSISTARRQCLQLAPIINVAADIPKGQVHLQNVPKTNQANYNIAPPETDVQDAPAATTPTNKASKYTSGHMGYNNVIRRRSDKALTTPHCSRHQQHHKKHYQRRPHRLATTKV